MSSRLPRTPLDWTWPLAATPSLAQEPEAGAGFSLLALVSAWFPLILLGIFLWWFVRRTGATRTPGHMDRGRVHMERVEQQNADIIAALERIEKLLSQRQ